MYRSPRWTEMVLVAALAGGLARAQSTERVSVDSGGAQGNGDSKPPSLSANGRFVVFASSASNLVPGDTNNRDDVFVHDRQSGTTERVSIDAAGVEANSDSTEPSISADSRFVVFTSFASNLVAGDSNGCSDVFVHDRQTGTIERVSVDSNGAQGVVDSSSPSISADGRFVAFQSLAANLVAGDTNGRSDIFVRDRQSGTTERVSLDSGGAQGNGDSLGTSISADGRCVAFASRATNLVAGDTNGWMDAFVRDRQSGTTERVSLDSGGSEGNNDSRVASISSDGRYVAFFSDASNLVAGDTTGARDILVRDRQSGATERVSVDSGGGEGNLDSVSPWISADGRFVAFRSFASNLVTGDTNARYDVFVHDRVSSYPGIDLCQPGTGGVIACPCSNPPGGAPRGCENSSGTGGAQLTSSGTATLSFDTVVFVTNGERPSATSVVLQGSSVSTTGLVFGQGVRCVSGGLKRLYTKTASGGAIHAPAAGDAPVSARSAALGDGIAPGTSRWYAVYYRDPVVLGGCPGSSTFNLTQTQQIPWGA